MKKSTNEFIDIVTKPFEKSAPLQTAVLFIVFNRPDTTSQVFEEIRKAKPPRLYVAADGSREGREGEQEKVDAVRKISTDVDWPCEVKTLFRQENLGCKYAVSGAITWFFENEEQGIILEDDCLPSQSFFWFCEGCLDKYKNDLRIWDVTGSNSLTKVSSPVASSYCYSRYGLIWGWATWRNRWRCFDPELLHAKSLGLFDIVLDSLEKRELPKQRLEEFNRVINGLDTWDYQWFFTRVSNSGLSVVPTLNLISNIGFGEDATHTFTSGPQSFLTLQELVFPLKSPPCLIRDKVRDIEYITRYVRRPFRQRVKNYVSSWFHWVFQSIK